MDRSNQTRTSSSIWAVALLATAVFVCQAARVLAQERVSFSTQDGALIYADLYRTGNRGVVLAHGGQFNKENWRDQALGGDYAAEAAEANPEKIEPTRRSSNRRRGSCSS